MCELGENRVCDQCGKAFYMPAADMWCYKKLSYGHALKESSKTKYFCKYTCMTAWERNYEAKKEIRKIARMQKRKNGQLHRKEVQQGDGPGDEI